MIKHFLLTLFHFQNIILYPVFLKLLIEVVLPQVWLRWISIYALCAPPRRLKNFEGGLSFIEIVQRPVHNIIFPFFLFDFHFHFLELPLTLDFTNFLNFIFLNFFQVFLLFFLAFQKLQIFLLLFEILLFVEASELFLFGYPHLYVILLLLFVLLQVLFQLAFQLPLFYLRIDNLLQFPLEILLLFMPVIHRRQIRLFIFFLHRLRRCVFWMNASRQLHLQQIDKTQKKILLSSRTLFTLTTLKQPPAGVVSVFVRIIISYILEKNLDLYYFYTNYKELTMMDAKKKSTQLMLLNNNLLDLITNFLNEQDLLSLSDALKQIKHDERLFKIAYGKLTFLKYINKSDRSYYYSLFQNQQFLKIQNYHLTFLSLQKMHNFAQFPNTLCSIVDSGLNSFPQHLQIQAKQKLTDMVVDPGILMPRLHRQMETEFIESSFQSFLLSNQEKSELDEAYMEEIFSNLKDYCDENDEKYFLSMMKSENVVPRTVRNSPQIITRQNANNFLIKGHGLNNLIVSLFALADWKIAAIEEYLNYIENPFHLLVELLVRYNQFQSMVISIEENFEFLFKNYEEMYRELFGGTRNSFSYWKPAFMKWTQQMSKFHTKTNQIFCSLMREKINSEALKSLSEEQEDLYQTLIVNCKQSEIDFKQEVYQIVEKDSCDLSALTANYQEYLLDLSINESKISWNGHTDLAVDETYLIAEDMIIESEEKFLTEMKERKAEEIEDYLMSKSEALIENLKPRTAYRVIKQIEEIFGNVEISLKKLEEKNRRIEYLNLSEGQNLKESSMTTDSESSSITSEIELDYIEYVSDDEEISA